MITATEALSNSISCAASTELYENIPFITVITRDIETASALGETFLNVDLSHWLFQIKAECSLSILYLLRKGYSVTLSEESSFNIDWLSPNEEDDNITLEQSLVVSDPIWEAYTEAHKEDTI